MDKLLEILNEVDDSIDFENEDKLIDNHILDSFTIIMLVGELEDAYDITIDAAEMTPENFNSAEAMLAMIERLQED
ncbi:MAG: acyl carrier protein [Lachnospiraceae bacterium]|nr:acyl carrier protein [Lachnospiraceae bacterium]